ncbi:MAG: DNA-binding protein WhiA [Lachnospiraceae bacterium]|nr:DNA-binding protein WhiA [Lachnospiraceae bacterium]MBR4573641.1 DNA-binding protein WhiA [Lachnospiraceae bacterium]
MSYSGNIKDELVRINAQPRHCMLAELAAIYDFCGKGSEDEGGKMVISSENELTVRKCFTLLKKTFNMYKDCSADAPCFTKKGADLLLVIDDPDEADKVRTAIKVTCDSMRSCCRRAYIRGAFLAAGSVSDPEKSYHLEIVCQQMRQAHFLAELLKSFDVEAKITDRKKHFVLYVKDGTNIAMTLNIMGAHVALMDFENTRILKDMRNMVNRKVNCETANIGKTVTAAQRQIDDIGKLRDSSLYGALSPELKEMADLRVSYPELTLTELGKLCSPAIGKSGVNHRLRKLSQMAVGLSKGGEL